MYDKYYVRLVPLNGYAEPYPETFGSEQPGSTLMTLAEVRDLEKKFLSSKSDPVITFRLEAEPEHMSLTGYFSKECGWGQKGTSLERSLKRRLDKGDQWAWCCIKVTCTCLEGGEEFSGEQYLGACSYKNGQEFIDNQDYWPQMCEEAFEAMNQERKILHYDQITPPEQWSNYPVEIVN